jgi:hypothetical protein
MSEKKTIQINPELFKLSNKTRKKPPKPDTPKIQLKTAAKQQTQKTLRKNVMRMIRDKQQEVYRNLFDTKKAPVATKPPGDEFKKEFEDSLQFFSTLASKPSEVPLKHNMTFKNTSALQSSIPKEVSPMIHVDLPEAFIEEPTAEIVPIRPSHIPPPPQYGCMKNGSLPTFRQYTRKNYDAVSTVPSYPVPSQSIPSYSTPSSSYSNPSQSIPSYSNHVPSVPSYSTSVPSYSTPSQSIPSYSNPIRPDISLRSTPMSFVEKPLINTTPVLERMESKGSNRIKYLKRKKIFKRTYRIGRNKSSIGVLVSNKTIRNRISTQAQLLKQTPIHDVRKFLIKKGFIKIGTTAPNDVLRKMYESVSLVCGEVQNHNPENLLYNFVHDSN